MYYQGTCIEGTLSPSAHITNISDNHCSVSSVVIVEWFFTFGYVIPHSKNSWQQTIDAAPPSEMLPAEVLSGNIVFETSFFDDKTFLCKNSVRIFYV